MAEFLSGLDKGDLSRWCTGGLLFSLSPDSLDSTGRNEGALLWRAVPVFVLSVSGQPFIQRHWLPAPESLTLWCFMGGLTSWDRSDFQQETDARVQNCAWRLWDASACTAVTYVPWKAGSLYKRVQTFHACEPWFVEQTGPQTYQTGSQTDVMCWWRRRSNILYAVCSNKSCLSFHCSIFQISQSRNPRS